jgi:hypothetical protein
MLVRCCRKGRGRVVDCCALCLAHQKWSPHSGRPAGQGAVRSKCYCCCHVEALVIRGRFCLLDTDMLSLSVCGALWSLLLLLLHQGPKVCKQAATSCMQLLFQKSVG